MMVSADGHAPPGQPNRLIDSKSPYLLQHAYNPVDWHPWGPEAFELAQEKDLPVFLSIGYSTCHWCHVMERESFEDPEVAELINASFIAIKVDREERPDVDQVYMSVCEMMTGHGGWPLTVILTPDRRPFFAGTYFPKRSRFGRIGLIELLQQVTSVWHERRTDVLTAAEEITRLAREGAAARGAKADAVSRSLLAEGAGQLAAAHDKVHGGFGSSPKFPQPHNLSFLLRHWHAAGDAQSLAICEHTLRAMRLGGIYDQLGGGFHRYSTDARWLLPHFEKMLYDQALLVLAYLEAYQATGTPQYAGVASDVLAYVAAELTSPTGTFYSAEDADSEGEEGLFYLWRESELRELLPDAQTAEFIETYRVTPDGNFADEATGKRTGRNVLHLAGAAGWARLGRMPDALRTASAKLLAHRAKRERPFRDDKCLVDWNGLMIAALARAARVLGEARYAATAARAAEVLLSEAYDHDGRLRHRFRDGEWAIPAYLDDYAYLAWGLIELYWATWDARYLHAAVKLVDQAIDLFGDPEAPGLYLTAHDAEELISRTKPVYDGATPSGNSVMLLNLVLLGRLLGRAEYEDTAGRLAEMLAGASGGQAWGHGFFLAALDTAIGPTTEIVISGAPGAAQTREMIEAAGAGFAPRELILYLPSTGPGRREVLGLAPWLEQLPTPAAAGATAYMCRDGTCGMPVHEPSALRELLVKGRQERL